MYEKLIGRKIKIVFPDGDHISVIFGIVLSYDSDLSTIEIEDDLKHISVYINVRNIQKLEVLL